MSQPRLPRLYTKQFMPVPIIKGYAQSTTVYSELTYALATGDDGHSCWGALLPRLNVSVALLILKNGGDKN
jgi:hypothetical protein